MALLRYVECDLMSCCGSYHVCLAVVSTPRVLSVVLRLTPSPAAAAERPHHWWRHWIEMLNQAQFVWLTSHCYVNSRGWTLQSCHTQPGLTTDTTMSSWLLTTGPDVSACVRLKDLSQLCRRQYLHSPLMSTSDVRLRPGVTLEAGDWQCWHLAALLTRRLCWQDWTLMILW